MKSALSFLLVVVVVGVIGGVAVMLLRGGSSGGPSTESPGGTVELFYRTVEGADIDKVAILFTPAQRDDVRSFAELFFASSVEISKLRTEVTSQTDTAATVDAFYHIKADGTDKAEASSFKLRKVSGEWLIVTGKLLNAPWGGEGGKAEFDVIVAKVAALMTDNKLKSIPNPVFAVATNDMSAFPDATSAAGSADKLLDPNRAPYTAGADKDGYLLYRHDKTADAAQAPSVNYVAFSTSAYYYTVDADGTVHQWDDAAKTVEYTYP